MRRFIGFTLALALILSLTACFGPPVDPDTVQESIPRFSVYHPIMISKINGILYTIYP